MKVFEMWDGAGVGRKMQQDQAKGWGLALLTLHALAKYPQRSGNCKFEPGLPGCSAGVFAKAEE